jgi:hypothetical protein
MILKRLLLILTVGVIPLGACAALSAPSVEKTEAERLVTITGTLTLVGPAPITEGNIAIIDTHSQIDQQVEMESIIKLMDQAGVAAVILSTRGTVTPEELVSFAAAHSGRIIPAVRTKGYMDNDEQYYQILQKQVSMRQYGAMAEVLMYHAQKGSKAPEIIVQPDDNKVLAALNFAVEKKWPFIVHIEFVAAG